MARQKKRAKTSDKWMQSARARMEAKGTVGAFTKYCKRKGYKGVTNKCIEEGLRSPNPRTRKRANFARNARKIAKRRKKG